MALINTAVSLSSLASAVGGRMLRSGRAGPLAHVIKAGMIRLDGREFSRAASEAFRYSRKTQQGFLDTQARGVVGILLDITPPGSMSVHGLAAKRRGEKAVKRDALRLFIPVRKGFDPTVNVEAHWAARRRRSDGRVPKAARKGDRVRVKSTEFNAAVKRHQSHVGRLAHGWYRAARQLKLRVAAWVAHHSTAEGEYTFALIGQDRAKVVIANNVRYAGQVKDFDRRVAWAVKQQTHAIRRGAEAMARLKAQQAGFATS